MTEFQAYLAFGLDHILNINAYDHLLFIATLAAAYPLNKWKRIVLVLTAFTLGHCVTLAFSAIGLYMINPTLVEVLIACTILTTAVYNFLSSRENRITKPHHVLTHYLIAFCFGLIHGLGFAGQFHALMGNSQQLLLALFAFNLGVELGQIAVVGVILILLLIMTRILTIRYQAICFVISLIAGITAVILILQRVQGF